MSAALTLTIRLTLSAVLICFVYRETGWATALFASLTVLAVEALTYSKAPRQPQ